MEIGVTEYQAKKLKEHTDLYWMHYYTANVAIADGDVEGYENQLQISRVEIEAIENIFDKVIKRRHPGSFAWSVCLYQCSRRRPKGNLIYSFL